MECPSGGYSAAPECLVELCIIPIINFLVIKAGEQPCLSLANREKLKNRVVKSRSHDKAYCDIEVNNRKLITEVNNSYHCPTLAWREGRGESSIVIKISLLLLLPPKHLITKALENCQ